MPDSSTDPLINALARRVRDFLRATEISQRTLAQLIGSSEPNFSSFLAGKSSLSAAKSLKLMQVLGSSKAQLESKLGDKMLNGRILALQEKGKPMRFDGGGWTPREGDSGADPNSWGDDNNLHRQAIQIINDYASKTAKARPNPNGSTEPARHIDDNAKSRTPGPRGDRFSRR
jgi:transcriptional regulator with XRE-family HTH domain